ncbi:PREDICTED: abnormal spindle-like microcephaly-associated protein homolog [Polistes dominula]|uniref:Abnormal spindle-like microcephaly-associated protein homolog n=1 Tax=Polistes dominula TaxID=743375 RepID=A0ABM1I849_POLDO|nr:PREDICTED: abnormal spindle-like microcephaly-associated protein homolog [Polistes dominula]
MHDKRQRDDDDDRMKANTAATKIQANFRGYRVRKQLKETKSPQQQQQQQQQLQPKRQQSDDDEESFTSSSSTSTLKRQNTREALEEKSATKIQAGIRGYLVRKKQQAEQLAATRIQANFRGFRTRKLLKQNGQ